MKINVHKCADARFVHTHSSMLHCESIQPGIDLEYWLVAGNIHEIENLRSEKMIHTQIVRHMWIAHLFCVQLVGRKNHIGKCLHS